MKTKAISNAALLKMLQPIGDEDDDLHLAPAEMQRRIAINQLILKLAKLSPEKRFEIVQNEAKRRGLI